MRIFSLAVLIWVTRAYAADISGDWIAQVSGNFGDPQYFRATLRTDGAKLDGSWNDGSLEGSITGTSLEFSIRQPGGHALGTFKGSLHSADLSGEGVMEGPRRGANRAGKQPVTWKMTRSPKPSAGGPKTWDFEPKE